MLDKQPKENGEKMKRRMKVKNGEKTFSPHMVCVYFHIQGKHRYLKSAQDKNVYVYRKSQMIHKSALLLKLLFGFLSIVFIILSFI